MAEKDFSIDFKVSQKIYGRQKELSQLEQTINDVAHGASHTVIIAGFSGVGKSSLVEEINYFKNTKNIIFISGKFQQYKSNIPYFALVEALNVYFDKLLLSKKNELDSFKEKYNKYIREQGGVLTSVFPKLELIVGKQPEIDKLVGAEAENRFIITFLDFLKLIATKEKPLVLFLDDLQWTDLVSLNILKAIIKNKINYIFIGLAYRDNEVDIHHPFHHFMDEMKTFRENIQHIKLQDLKTQDIAHLLRDSRIKHPEQLAELIHRKTSGNSFFVHQFIKKIVDKQLLNYLPEQFLWQANIKTISELEVSENVVFFMQQTLKDLDTEITDVLKTIGALGHNAEYKILEVVLCNNIENIRRILSQPFSDRLLIESGNKIRFAHDKIQQACYQLNNEAELPEIHYNIACILIEHNLYKTIDDLFSVVSHLNKGFVYVKKQPQRYFDIYLHAALKSKEISAYSEFLEYIEKAFQLISQKTIEKMRYKCYSEYHVALHLNGKYEEADNFFETKLLNYHDMFALKDNYVTKVSQDSMLGKYEAATSFGLSILKKLDIHINMSPDISELTKVLKKLREQFKKQGIKDVSDLAKIPKRNPAQMQFICELISAIVPGSFFFTPLVSSLLIFETIHLALKNGVYSSMGYPFSVATAPFVLVENNYIRGYEYAEFAIQISGNDKRSLGNSKHLFILFCWHWLKPLKDNRSLEIAREAFHLLLKGGDIQMSGFIFYNTIAYLFERGDTLEDVLTEITSGLDYARKTTNFHAIAPYSVFEQFVLSMISDDASTTDFEINNFDETQFFNDNKDNAMGQCYMCIYKTQYLYLHKHYDKAYEYAIRSKDILNAIVGFIPVSTHYFYAALCFCHKYMENKELEEELNNYIKQLKQWADQIPDNWLQKYYIAMAEKLRFSKNKLEAIEYYEKAIHTAQKNGFIHDCALAKELFADFWFEQNNSELGNALLEMSYKMYQKWGAKLKLKTILNNHPELANKLQTKSIDLLNIIEAQNLLAQETRIDVLLKKMLDVLIKVTGAEKCYLILKEDDWQIEAYIDIQGKESILESIELKSGLLSVDLVNYVIRTKKSILSDELKAQITDKYFVENQPKSTIVLPVINQSEIVAVIYLEHTEIEGLFDEDKQETIRLLSSQMAISLVNARLYQNLEEKVKSRTEELQASNEELIAINEELHNTNDQLDKTLKDLTRSEAELRESNTTKDKFFSIIAHDLKGPIGSVANMLTMLQNRELAMDGSMLSTLSKSMQNTYKLLEDLLIWSRSQKKSLVASMNLLNVNEIINVAIAVHQLAADEKNIALRAKIIDDKLTIYADWQMIDTILRNLINNAIKFTPNSGSVTVSANRIDNMVLINVSDTGIGIDKTTISKLFKIDSGLTSRKGTNYESGTGLGLIVCKELVELNKGKIGVNSIVNRGSNFWIKLPAVSSNRIKQSDWLKFLSAQKTLYIEDNPLHVEHCNVIINRLGLKWDISSTGKEGLQKVLSTNYTLLFLDIQLPDIHGIEIAKIIRSKKNKAIIIIALSSYNQYEIERMEKEKLFDGYLQKPLEKKALESIFSGY